MTLQDDTTCKRHIEQLHEWVEALKASQEVKGDVSLVDEID